MRSNKVRIGLAFAAFLLIFSILTLVFWDFMLESIVTPIYYLIWVGGLTINSVSQEVFLVFLILISLVIALNAIGKIQIRDPKARSDIKVEEEASRYRYWMKLHTNSFYSEYSRQKYAYEARKLILSILSFQEGLDLSEAERKVANDELKVPPVVKKLIQERDLPATQRSNNRFWSWGYEALRFIRRKDLHSDPLTIQNIEEIICFIESQLEINHDGNQS